jgi:hypothetical protein
LPVQLWQQALGFFPLKKFSFCYRVVSPFLKGCSKIGEDSSHGKVAERLNAPVLKTDVVKAIEGSNPSLSVFIQSVPELKGANGQINVHALPTQISD